MNIVDELGAFGNVIYDAESLENYVIPSKRLIKLIEEQLDMEREEFLDNIPETD